MRAYLQGMKRTFSAVAALFLAFAAAPVAVADDASEPILPDAEDMRDLRDLAERWARDLAGRMEPMAERLRALVDDLDAYEAPEMLPNGDIVIRRRPDAPPPNTHPAEDGDGISL